MSASGIQLLFSESVLSRRFLMIDS